MGPLSAATLPYTNDFSSTGFPNQNNLTLGSGALTATATGASTVVAYGSDQFSNVQNASFSLSTQFTVTSIGDGAGSDISVTLGAFGLNAAFTGTSDATRYLQAGWVLQGSNAGALRLIEVDGTNTTLGSVIVDANGGTAGVFTLNTTYTLRLDVANTGANTYSLSLGLFDVTGGTQIGASATATGFVALDPSVGGYYEGVRARLPNVTGTTTVAFDSFSAAAVPEPTTYALLLGGAALVGLNVLRRRRTI